ncbi:MAG: alpha/beta hydrolase domain-containing protein [Acidimicrobiia bacterium]
MDVRVAVVTGPIEGSRPPFGAPPDDVLDANGYVAEEFRIEGETVGYGTAGGTRLGDDGHWEVAETGVAPYRTRILVVRPAEAAGFNGTVLLNWQNVSAGREMGGPTGDEVYRGFAWVGVSAQEVGLYGFPFGMDRGGGGSGGGRPLVEHDPERYGELHHPGDPGAYELFSQAARAVGPGRTTGAPGGVAPDPMGGLPVRRVIATGASQSAMRLACYANAVHRRDRVVDGFLLAVWEGRAPRPEEGPVAMGVRTRVRDDLGVPVVVVNSEFEVPHLATVGEVDGPLQRIWEVAGTAHAHLPPGRPDGRGWEPNSLHYGRVHESALRWIHGWVAGGPPAPAQPRVEVDPGPAPRVRRDELGNAVGGIRLPELEAPVREYRGMAIGTGRPPLFGASRPLADDVIRRLYPTRRDYLERWGAAVDRLAASGAIRPEDVEVLRARGESVVLPADLAP